MTLKLAYSLNFFDLYNNKGLRKIDSFFHEFFAQKNHELYKNFCVYKNLDKKQRDEVLINSAKVLEDFLVYLFDIEKENSVLKKQHDDLQKIYFVKREFVQRIIAKKYKTAPDINGLKILQDLKISFENIDDLEKKLAQRIFLLLSENHNEEFEKLSLYAVFALYCEEGKALHRDGSLFILPQKIDHDNLVGGCGMDNKKIRDGFNLTDSGFNLNKTLSEAHYCIFCHKQEKDSCRNGLREKNSADFQKNPLGMTLEGCPLDQKISEMNLLKSVGFSIAAMAVAAIDNPLMAGTGHRICNDCMKSCIFQKQDPVNIPQIETKTLKDILLLPWGFEIYGLLTRWNPLKIGEELPKENSGKKILIAGLGPAGYTLAHYLLNDGHNIIAIDGLKIEPLNKEISGIDAFGNHVDFLPIKYIDDIYEPLQSRLIQGFGGVAEYGITSRWDKNFLTIIRLLLERRKNFRMFGGLRFGSSIDDLQAFDEYGFDHIALCIGTGRPNIIDIKNNFAKGIRSSSDFLMTLQLTGAFKKELFTNLQLRLPIIIIGAGLTAVDTACEAQEYYILQIEKFYHKFQTLRKHFGTEKIWQNFNEEEKIIADEFLTHAEELRLNGKREFIKKHHSKILYRKKIQDSPAYKINHEELLKAFEQGIEFIENQEPAEAILDKFSHISAIKCQNGEVFECRSLLVAAGTSPNISIKIEDNLNLNLDGKYFAQINKENLQTHSVKQGEYSFFTRIDDDKKAISFFGDLHPNFEGNVVKAMASAKLGYKKISNILRDLDSGDSRIVSTKEIIKDFTVKIHKITKISNYLSEIIISAPLLAKSSSIGQIFRLQNYHTFAAKRRDQILAMEGVAVTALNVDKENGLITGIILDFGGSTSLIKNFKKGEPCIFMGPSGNATEITKDETVLLIGGGRGNMPLIAIAEEFKKNNCKIIFCAAYRQDTDITRQNEIKKVSDILIYAVEGISQNQEYQHLQDVKIQGNVTQVLQKYFAKNHHKIDRIFTIGNDKMMAEIARIRHENIIPEIAQAPIAIASLNAPMQCMMKGVCSQCLQKRQNENGEYEYFYACAVQDQNMDRIDFKHLTARCDQNSTQEKMTKLWIEYLNSIDLV